MGGRAEKRRKGKKVRWEGGKQGGEGGRREEGRGRK